MMHERTSVGCGQAMTAADWEALLGARSLRDHDQHELELDRREGQSEDGSLLQSAGARRCQQALACSRTARIQAACAMIQWLVDQLRTLTNDGEEKVY